MLDAPCEQVGGKNESNTEPAGESAASSSATEEASVPETTEELVSCETSVNYSEGESVLFDLNDPGTGPENLTDTQRCLKVSKLMNKLINEPDIGKYMNSLYCLPCKLFAHTQSESKSFLVRREGFTNWKKVGERLSERENSLNHKNCFCSWKNLEASLGKRGIDKDLQVELEKEESHWKAVLHSIANVILHLAKQGSPLRGSNQTQDFSDPRCEVKEAKYYAVMFDCTPDVSHLEQMSQVLRYVRVVGNVPEITKRVIDFFTVSDKTGEALSEQILKTIEQEGLDIKNCRGQSYDNGANMVGKYQGI
ncbi:hypothetical protein AVEN_58782-1 [Araneus ventricosus]|uniref:Uncharacterized protein n=1 Tax=Araneus ventricosus TaxID=182803 RepID=A0A4Y2GJZ7_ARAVE|nr:hypothetical protein AVEN_58782-1 [Araneus ventricosus]